MPGQHNPRRGSMAYSPRKRARSETAHIGSWAIDSEGTPRIQGFAGYKVGMTHIMAIDYRKKSTTAGQEIRMPVTVVEFPPMKIAAVRGYIMEPYGLRSVGEVWAKDVDKELEMRIPLAKKSGNNKTMWKRMDECDLEEIRFLVYTTPKQVSGIPKKKPEIMEIKVDGGDLPSQYEYSKEMLGKEIDIGDFTENGEMLDALAITTGRGFQGHVKRWGVKLLTHKNSKHRRMIGTLGPWNPSYVRSSVPQAGQTGYHQRTEYNKRILTIGENPEDINPKGGFIHYGFVNNKYAIFHGSLPGPTKRLIRFRRAIRFSGKSADAKVAPEITMISKESPQGV